MLVFLSCVPAYHHGTFKSANNPPHEWAEFYKGADALMNASRSSLTWALRVEHRPCGAPG